MMTSKMIYKKLAFCFLLAISSAHPGSADDKPQATNGFVPSFPSLNGVTRLNIISEEFDSEGGYIAREEYVDFEIGKATFIQTTSSGRETFHMDAATETSYYYAPYECWAYSFPEKPTKLPRSGFWVREDQSSGSMGAEKKMYLTGVTAVWFNSRGLPKTYSKVKNVYSTTKDVYQTMHKWEMKMDGMKASFYFNEIKQDDKPTDKLLMTLETIEIESKDRKTTINLVSYEFDLDDSVYDRELQLPLNYGCYKTGVSTENMRNLIAQVENTELGERFKVEAVATKQTGGDERLTSTVSLEFARDGRPQGWLQLLRQRNSKMDLKSILDHVRNVKYEIDMIRGTCSMASLGDLFPIEETRMTINFPNGLELKLDRNMLDVLFLKPQQYQFTKSVETNGSKYIYMTLPKSDLFEKTRGSARIVRKYSVKGDEMSVKLESVTMWLMDVPASSKSDIHEIYHFTIQESENFFSQADRARVFDISEECYLNNDKEMKYGRDYVWMEFHYSLPPDELQLVPSETRMIKHELYYNIRAQANINFLRIPRLELMFDDTGLTARMLMLDSPPLHLIFDKTVGLVIMPKAGDEKDYFKEIAPDARHCSELCRLSGCGAFSFCENSYSCVLAHPQLNDSLASRVEARNGCDLYKNPPFFNLNEHQKTRLHSFISGIQRHDLGNLQLPPLPEELTLPRSESGISVTRENQLRAEYARDARKFLEDRNLNSVSLFSGSVVAVPDRFEVEQDPLAEFGLDGKDELELEDDQSSVPAFHEGLSQFRFNYRAFENLDEANQKQNDKNKREYRRYVGVDYEQCALACVDGKCSSFSYCKLRQECVITNIWDLQQSGASDFIQADIDCVIAQRDFLSKFHRLPEVKHPPMPKEGDKSGTKHMAVAANPSECAHGCVVESGFNCLAFTYCRQADTPTGGAGGGGTCFYSENRSMEPSLVKKPEEHKESTGCDHYSRSYLADFTLIEYRQILPEALEQLKTSQIESQSVDRCAELCATEVDCTAFQFCYDPEESSQQNARQRCTMVESPPENKKADYRIVLGKDGKVIQAGKLFVNNQNCHVFALRKGSSEAELKQIAFKPLSEDIVDDQESGSKWRGMSLVGGFFLFLCSTVTLSALGVVFIVAHRNSEMLRSRMDHLRALFGRYQ